VSNHLLSRAGGNGDLGGFLTRERPDTLSIGNTVSRDQAARTREGAPDSHAKRERRQRCQKLIGSGRRGKKTPTLLSPHFGDEARRLEAIGKVCPPRSAEAGSSVVKHSVPRKSQGAQDSMRPPRDESRARSRERTRYGYTQIVQVAEVGRTHRASWTPEGRKPLWSTRALARRKLEAPPDAEHGWREGETVRGTALTIKSTRRSGVWVSARTLSIRQKMFSGRRPFDLHRSDDAEVLRLAGEFLVSSSARSTRRTAHRSAQRPVGRAYE
jgi:hypothetical protein